MIGRRGGSRRLSGRSRVLAAVVAVLVAATFGQRSPHPEEADPARVAGNRAHLATLASRTATALDALAEQLRAAIDVATRGAGLTRSGRELPGPHLLEAAELVRAAGELAEGSLTDLTRLNGTLAAATAPQARVEPRISPVALDALAAQLEGAAAAADQFVQLRWATEDVLAAMERALTALDDGELEAALADAADARTALARVAAWRAERDGAPTLPTLPLWSATAGRLVDALAGLAEAALADDEAAAEQAADEFETASEEARRADLALGIALAEGGGAITAAALSQLADALGETELALEATRQIADA